MKNLDPRQAWQYLQENPRALMVDVRMEIESLYVGRPVGIQGGVVNVPWYEYPEFTSDAANFTVQVLAECGGDKSKPLVLICRSGQRTLDAGAALESDGFTQVFNVLNGFEGELDANDHRSTVNGWRFEGLPWGQV